MGKDGDNNSPKFAEIARLPGFTETLEPHFHLSAGSCSSRSLAYCTLTGYVVVYRRILGYTIHAQTRGANLLQVRTLLDITTSRIHNRRHSWATRVLRRFELGNWPFCLSMHQPAMYQGGRWIWKNLNAPGATR